MHNPSSKAPLQSSSPFSNQHLHTHEENPHYSPSWHTSFRKKIIQQEFTFQFHILYALVNIRFPCRFLVKCCDPLSAVNSALSYDTSVSTLNNNARTINGRVDFDERLSVKVEVPFDSETGIFEQREYFIVMTLISDRRPDEKLVGRYKVNLAEVIEQGKYEHLDEYELQYCAVKGKLAFSIGLKEKPIKADHKLSPKLMTEQYRSLQTEKDIEQELLNTKKQEITKKEQQANDDTDKKVEQKQTNQPESQQHVDEQRVDDKNSVQSQYASSEQLQHSNILREVKMPFNQFASRKESEEIQANIKIEIQQGHNIGLKHHAYIGEEEQNKESYQQQGTDKQHLRDTNQIYLQTSEHSKAKEPNSAEFGHISQIILLQQQQPGEQTNQIVYELSKNPSSIQYSSVIKSVEEEPVLGICPSTVLVSEEEVGVSEEEILSGSVQSKQVQQKSQRHEEYKVVITKVSEQSDIVSMLKNFQNEYQKIQQKNIPAEQQPVYADICFQPQNLIDEQIEISQQTSTCPQNIQSDIKSDIQQLTEKSQQIDKNIKNAKIVPVTLVVLLVILIIIGQLLWSKNTQQFN